MLKMADNAPISYTCCDCRSDVTTNLETVPEPPRCDACHLEAVAFIALSARYLGVDRDRCPLTSLSLAQLRR